MALQYRADRREATADGLRIRLLAPGERAAAFSVVRQLRTHLDLDEYLARLAVQARSGYELAGAFAGEALVGALGMRQVDTLARGAHLHVDDLVVDTAHRGRGVGKALLAYAEADAAHRGLCAVFLDSRPEVRSVYAALGYEPHPAQLMRKRLAAPATEP
jgi:ribosomal protein S18 acetylase RimI-like enzyme